MTTTDTRHPGAAGSPAPIRDSTGKWASSPETRRRDADIVARVAAGQTFRHIARELDRSVATVHEGYQRGVRRLTDTGQPVPPPGPCPACGRSAGA